MLTITRLDRLARSTRDLLDIAERLDAAEAGLRSLAEPWADTTSPAGRMVLTIFAGIAEFERSLIHERTSSGRAAAKAKGVRFGRPPALSAEQIALARQLIEGGQKPRAVAQVATPRIPFKSVDTAVHAVLPNTAKTPAAVQARGWGNRRRGRLPCT